jgi:hypothetical protein
MHDVISLETGRDQVTWGRVMVWFGDPNNDHVCTHWWRSLFALAQRSRNFVGLQHVFNNRHFADMGRGHAICQCPRFYPMSSSTTDMLRLTRVSRRQRDSNLGPPDGQTETPATPMMAIALLLGFRKKSWLFCYISSGSVWSYLLYCSNLHV